MRIRGLIFGTAALASLAGAAAATKGAEALAKSQDRAPDASG